MDTKLKGDIAEQAAILEGLKRSWNVLQPVGDRLSYDIVYEIEGSFLRIQVKSAWFDETRKNWVIDTRRTKTNRRQMVRDSYSEQDFDFALVYIDELNVFYIFPVSVFIGYASEIHLVESDKRQRKPQSALYRNAWNLLSHWAVHREICV
ncbi:MAG: endonuclease [Candidatus Kapaibacterium sp.]|nr:MAG: endonuclease [Candidatus Kapabacteria bacterium]